MIDDAIEELIELGDYRAAANAYEERGQLAEARDLYERLFDYTRAGQLAEQQGDHIEAVELFLKGNELQRAESVRRRLMAELAEDIPQALALFERRGYFLQAAELAESIGRLEQAADLYAQGSAWDRAGQLYERIGRLREAGEAYETFLRGEPDNPEANLGLGRILQRFGRHKEVIPLLSRALAHPRTLDEAGRRIAFAFFKLQLLEAGRTALEQIGLPRTTDPEAFMRPFEDELMNDADSPAGQPRGASPGGGALEGRYRLEKSLGGRFAASYSARDLLRDRQVTLRFLPGSAEENAPFYDELRRLSQPPAPGHVRILEINPQAGFFATEAIEGRTLLTALRSQKPPNALQCRAFALSALDALIAAHRRGILHGALTPSAVVLMPGGLCLVDDWGLHLLERRMATQTGGPESTFAYRAPELNLGRSADARADLYSVAAVLFRCLRGAAPALGQGGQGWQAWPEPFGAFFTTALAADEGERFPNSDAFRRALLALPWPLVAERRLTPEARPETGSADGDEGPRFVTSPNAPANAPLVTARDTLLHRNVRLLRLPPEDERSIHIVDRLHVLASPESPVFQNILRHDEEEGVIVLEVLREPPLAEAEPHKPLPLLQLAAPLIRALANAHSQNIGLGAVTPQLTRFDGHRLRVPTEGALLSKPQDNAAAQIADNQGFWAVLLALIGRPVGDAASPERLLDALLDLKQIASSDRQRLLGDAPDPNTSLANASEWFDELILTVETHLSRRRVYKRLAQLATANRDLSDRERDFLKQKRQALGLDEA